MAGKPEYRFHAAIEQALHQYIRRSHGVAPHAIQGKMRQNPDRQRYRLLPMVRSRLWGGSCTELCSELRSTASILGVGCRSTPRNIGNHHGRHRRCALPQFLACWNSLEAIGSHSAVPRSIHDLVCEAFSTMRDNSERRCKLKFALLDAKRSAAHLRRRFEAQCTTTLQASSPSPEGCLLPSCRAVHPGPRRISG